MVLFDFVFQTAALDVCLNKCGIQLIFFMKILFINIFLSGQLIFIIYSFKETYKKHNFFHDSALSSIKRSSIFTAGKLAIQFKQQRYRN